MAFITDALTGALTKVQTALGFTPATVFNVKDYGATGDGTTDDFDAITGAITAATDSGGVVYFPEGTYLTKSAIQLVANLTYRGAGQQSIIKLDANLNINVLEADTLTNVIVEDLTVDGNLANQTPQGEEVIQNGIYLYACSFCVVRNCFFINTAATGIFLKGLNTQCLVTGNVCRENQRNGIYLHFSDNTYNVISNNLIDTTYVYHGICNSDSHYNTYANNTVINSYNAGIRIDSDSIGNTVTGNVFSENLWGGIELHAESGTPLNNVVTGNVSVLNNREGINVLGAQNTLLASNMVLNNSQENAGYYDGILIDLFGTTHPAATRIIGNTVQSNHAYGLHVNDADATGTVAQNNEFNGETAAYLDASTGTTLFGNLNITTNTISGKLILDGDANLYRSAESQLTTDGELWSLSKMVVSTAASSLVDLNTSTLDNSNAFRFLYNFAIQAVFGYYVTGDSGEGNFFIDLYDNSDTKINLLTANATYVYQSFFPDSTGKTGFNNASPQYPVDVTGDINSSTGYRVAGTQGATGSFTSADGKTITVSGGIVTDIS